MKYDPARELPHEMFGNLFLDGRWRAPQGSERTLLIDPATEDGLIDIPQASSLDVDEAVAAARVAFQSGPWPRIEPRQRGALVAKLGEAIGARLIDFKRAWTGSVGGPTVLTDAIFAVVPEIFSYYGRLAERFEFVDTRDTFGGHAVVSREPVGVAALIVPWNYPLGILAYKLAPALVAGCTVVVKPAQEAPLEALLVAKLAQDLGFPKGVINVVTGGREVGERLVGHPSVDKVSFTGSTQTGVAIAKACAPRMARLSLELGGKSAAIVLEDAKLDEIIAILAQWTMPFSGQACLAQTRVLVPQARSEEIAQALAGAIGSMQVGDPWDPQTIFGPVVTARQRANILAMIDRAVEQGAHAIAGGGPHRGFKRGYYVEPTILTGVKPDMNVAREEVFGPVVAVVPYIDENEAVAIANDTDYGLHGTVFSADVGRASEVARRIRTGSIGVNCFQHDPAAPFGGFKLSGVGREGGPEGLHAFIEYKATYYPGSSG